MCQGAFAFTRLIIVYSAALERALSFFEMIQFVELLISCDAIHQASFSVKHWLMKIRLILNSIVLDSLFSCLTTRKLDKKTLRKCYLSTQITERSCFLSFAELLGERASVIVCFQIPCSSHKICFPCPVFEMCENISFSHGMIFNSCMNDAEPKKNHEWIWTIRQFDLISNSLKFEL